MIFVDGPPPAADAAGSPNVIQDLDGARAVHRERRILTRNEAHVGKIAW